MLTIWLRKPMPRLTTGGFRLSVACLAIVATATATSAPRSETLADALVTALETSPDLAANRAALRQLDENVAQARAGKRPTVDGSLSAGVDLTNTKTNRNGVFAPENDRDIDTDVTLGVTGSQNLFDFGETENAVKSALSERDGGRFDLLEVEQQVLRSAVNAYVNVLNSQERVAISQNNVRVIERELVASQDRFDVGEVTRTDVAQARSRLAQAQSDLVSNKGLLGQARKAYVRAIGVAPEALAPVPPLPDLPQSLAEAEAIAERSHPRIESVRQDIKSAEFGIEEAKAATLPSIDLGSDLAAQANRGSGRSDVFSAGADITATMPFYRGGVLRSQVRARQALEAQRRAELFDVTRDVLEEVGIAWEELTTARAVIIASRAQIEAAELAFEGVKEEANVGSRTTLDVLDAEQELLDARLSLVDARSDEYIAGYRLLAAVGVLTATHLGLAIEPYDPDEDYRAAQEIYLGWPEDDEKD